MLNDEQVKAMQERRAAVFPEVWGAAFTAGKSPGVVFGRHALEDFDALMADRAELMAKLTRMRTAALWLAENSPGTPVPDWVDAAQNDCSVPVEIELLDGTLSEPTEKGTPC